MPAATIAAAVVAAPAPAASDSDETEMRAVTEVVADSSDPRGVEEVPAPPVQQTESETSLEQLLAIINDGTDSRDPEPELIDEENEFRLQPTELMTAENSILLALRLRSDAQYRANTADPFNLESIL
jgi:hypothetical protein